MPLLQQRCAAQHLTFEELARRTGVPQATIAKIDAGTIRAQPSTLRRLAAALETDPAALRDELSTARRGREIPSTRAVTEWR